MTEYVLGFLFHQHQGACSVVLIRKTKPKNQAGRLNGVGGKIEPGESPVQAMVREFQEETGALVSAWKLIARLEGKDYRVFCFSAFGHPYIASTTEEIVGWYDVAEIPDNPDVMASNQWLIPFALSSSSNTGVLWLIEHEVTSQDLLNAFQASTNNGRVPVLN